MSHIGGRALRDIMISAEAPLAQFIVRHLEENVKEGLKRRAKRHGRSMEEEVRHILRNAVKDDRQERRKLGSRMAARFRRLGLTRDLPELRGGPPRPPDFER
jgi:plasmid stability protein